MFPLRRMALLRGEQIYCDFVRIVQSGAGEPVPPAQRLSEIERILDKHLEIRLDLHITRSVLREQAQNSIQCCPQFLVAPLHQNIWPCRSEPQFHQDARRSAFNTPYTQIGTRLKPLTERRAKGTTILLSL